MSIIIVGDLHLKNKDPFYNAQKEFLNYLQENYKDDTIIFTGDCFDSSRPHWSVYTDFKTFLQRRKNDTHIIVGNHDYNPIIGNSLQSFNLVSGVYVYEKPSEVNIENISFLMLPFQYKNDMDDYSELKGKYDYIVTHCTSNLFSSVYSQGIDFKLEGTYLHGHEHIQRDNTDKYGNYHIVLGVPITSRNLEEKQDHRILKIDGDNITNIKLKKYVDIETLDYGEFPKNKDSILNIKNAPSVNAVRDTYKDYFLREDGIEIKQELQESVNFDFGSSNSIYEIFNTFCVDNNVREDFQNTGVRYLVEASGQGE